MVLTLIMMLAAVGAAQTEPVDYAGSPPKHWHEFDPDWMKAFHNPMEGLEMGLDLRLREVYTRNMLTVNDAEGDKHWQRYRTRWSTKWHLDEDITFNTRLVWEFWTHCRPRGGAGAFFGQRSTDFDEAIFDHMNIQFRNAFDLPLTLTVGRQDIILGTGWLVLDGTPADGSRTIFFDAVRGTYQLTDTAKLDMIYIQQYDDESKWLKPFNHGAVRDRRRLTQNQDEKGIILYLTNKLSEMTSFDAYYMFKKDKQSRLAQRWRPLNGEDQETSVFGGRLFGNLDDNWSYSAEGAYQIGKYKAIGGRSIDHQAFGTNNKLQYSFHDELKNEVHVGYEYLSGNKQNSSKNEQFNTMWGDWPQFQRGGDLQSYIWTTEGNLGEVSNLHRFGVGHSFKPHQDWTMATDWNLLWADQNSLAGTAGFSNSGSFRGHMLTGLLTYQCCKNFRTQFLVDYFIPGSYYASPSGDQAMFARVNMEWTF